MSNIESKETAVQIVGDIVVFSTFALMFFGCGLGFFGENAGLAIGVVQLCLAGLFFTGSFRRLSIAPFWGNLNMVFAFVFGILGGTTNVLMSFGIELNPYVMAVPTTVAGVLMCATVPATFVDSLVTVLLNTMAALAVLMQGLAGFGLAPDILNPIASILLGGVGVLGVYSAISIFSSFSGINLPLGKPVRSLLKMGNKSKKEIKINEGELA